MSLEDSVDKTRKEIYPHSLKEEPANDLLDGDLGEVLDPTEEAAVDIDDLEL